MLVNLLKMTEKHAKNSVRRPVITYVLEHRVIFYIIVKSIGSARGLNYPRFVGGTSIIALCLSFTNTSKSFEKDETIQPPPSSCVFLTFTYVPSIFLCSLFSYYFLHQLFFVGNMSSSALCFFWI